MVYVIIIVCYYWTYKVHLSLCEEVPHLRYNFVFMNLFDNFNDFGVIITLQELFGEFMQRLTSKLGITYSIFALNTIHSGSFICSASADVNAYRALYSLSYCFLLA
jgi:hypothetical protein